jgi:hypothetical protein
VIKGWTKNKAYLIAIELPRYPLDNSVKIMQKVNPPNSITLQYSREQIIELIPSPPNDQNDWTTRAIKNKLTTLKDEEIGDFCQKVKDATFAFFKVKTEEVSTHFYLMAIAKNNNNNANDNNIQSTHSLDDEQRNPKTLPN